MVDKPQQPKYSQVRFNFSVNRDSESEFGILQGALEEIIAIFETLGPDSRYGSESLQQAG
jgi:hypothetical protein